MILTAEHKRYLKFVESPIDNWHNFAKTQDWTKEEKKLPDHSIVDSLVQEKLIHAPHGIYVLTEAGRAAL